MDNDLSSETAFRAAPAGEGQTPLPGDVPPREWAGHCELSGYNRWLFHFWLGQQTRGLSAFGILTAYGFGAK